MSDGINRAAAFRAVYGYLRTIERGITDKAFQAMRPAGGEDARHLARAVRNNAQADGAAEWLPTACSVLAEMIAAHNVTLPAAIEPLWRALQPDALSSYEMKEDTGFPFFLDKDHIEVFYRKQARINQPELFVRRYCGSWRVYRRSSGAPDRINRSFLNIKPWDVLEKLERPVPEFTLYAAREDEPGGFSARGGMYAVEDLMVLLGARIGRNTPVLLVWRQSVDFERATELARIGKGLMYTSNSDGRPIVAGFIAQHIPGSREARNDAYHELRRRERAAAGSVSAQELKDMLSPEDLAMLQAMGPGDMAMAL